MNINGSSIFVCYLVLIITLVITPQLGSEVLGVNGHASDYISLSGDQTIYEHAVFSAENMYSPEALPAINWAELLIIFFIAGAILIMFVYHLVLYFISRKDLSSLLFSLLLLFLGFRILTSNYELFLLAGFPISYNQFLTLWYVTTYSAPVFFISYVSSLYAEETRREVIYGLISVSIILTLIVLFISPELYDKTHKIFFIYLVVASSAMLFVLWKAIMKKYKSSLLFFAGHMFFYIVLLYEIIFVPMEHTHTSDLFSVGLLGYILLQSYPLSVRFLHAHIRNKDFEEEELRINQEFEQMMRDRSDDVLSQKNLLLEINRELEEQKEDMLAQSEMMEDINQLLEQEKKKSDSLLLNILPKHIAQELKLYGTAPTYYLPSVSVLFVDFVGFSEIVEKVDPQTLVDELHYYFANFDDVIKKYNLEKIKTIGDAYMCAGGLNTTSESPEAVADAQATVSAALELAEFMESYKEDCISLERFYFDCRIGIHTGPVVAGVVGKSKFAFDIWGQTVNIAKETESASVPGKVTISEITYNLVKDKFNCSARGEVTIKHNRLMKMYFVDGGK